MTAMVQYIHVINLKLKQSNPILVAITSDRDLVLSKFSILKKPHFWGQILPNGARTSLTNYESNMAIWWAINLYKKQLGKNAPFI